MIGRVLPLFAVIAIGVLCGAVRLFPSNPRAITVLNRFALYVGFPLLIVAGLASEALVLPTGPGFYLLHAVGAASVLGVVFLTTAGSRVLRDERGAITLGALFGNIAYLGIPFCRSVLGEAAAGLSALSAAIHITVGMLLGPFLLLRWNRTADRVPVGETIGRVVKQPLVWSPFVGLLVRAAPDDLRRAALLVADPVGRAAGLVALFMIGLYLFDNRRRLLHTGVGALTTTVLKLAVYPALMLGVMLLTAPLWPLTDTEHAVLILQSGMPVAITTFALAEEYRTGGELLASAIVFSTLASLVTLPLLALWVAP